MLDAEKFFADLDLNNLSLEMDDLEEMLKNCKDVVNRSLDKQIPYKMRKIPKVVNQILYDDELREMKRKMHRKERIWRKYWIQHQWIAFYEDCKYYFKQLYLKKKHYRKCEIHKLRNNNWVVYKIVSKLTGSAANNPVLEHESDMVLADKFIEFFMKKIKMIRQNLDSKEKFKVPDYKSIYHFFWIQSNHRRTS